MDRNTDENIDGRLNGEQPEHEQAPNLLMRLLYMVILALMLSLAQTVLTAVEATAAVTVNATLPTQAIAGGYFLGTTCVDSTTGETTERTERFDVTGLDATVASTTDRSVYGSGENVTITVVVSPMIRLVSATEIDDTVGATVSGVSTLFAPLISSLPAKTSAAA